MNDKFSHIKKLFADIGASEIFLSIAILASAYILVLVSRHILPRFAKVLPSKIRLIYLSLLPVLRLIIGFSAFLLIIPILFNINFQNFVFVLGTLGVALGFAVKDFVSSAIAGFVSVFERSYRVGDWIKISENYGEVISVRIRSLKVLTPDDNIVTIPHSCIWQDHISNSNDGSETLQCVADFFLANNQSIQKISQILRAVACSSAYLHYEKPVKVVAKNEIWATHVKLRAYPFDLRDQFAFITDLTLRGQNALREAGFEMADAPFRSEDKHSI